MGINGDTPAGCPAGALEYTVDGGSLGACQEYHKSGPMLTFLVKYGGLGTEFPIIAPKR